MPTPRPSRPARSTPPARLKRSQGRFGLHLDFHAGDGDKRIGERVTRAHVDAVLRAVRPDFLQVDSKGHVGRVSWLSANGTRAGGFVRDPLKVWRAGTAAAGVPLVVHYSGVWDDAALAAHPEWARVGKDGVASKGFTSVFGPYIDELLIPQLIELAREWQVDAAWVDGDCWAAHPDWSVHAQRAWAAQGHDGALPTGPEDPRWQEFLAFNREGFRAYVRRYVDALHAAKPGFEVASNWGWSSFMPEPVAAAVDFLSGDLDAQRGVDAARYQGRCLAGQGRAWDLMAWGFAAKGHEGFRAQGDKTPVQLCQEAAHVIALGGGFQVYITQNRDASVALPRLAATAAAGDFCRARAALCARGASVPQVLLLYHGASLYHDQVEPLFMGHAAPTEGLRGWLFALLDAQFSVDIRHEGALDGLEKYPLVVLPEWAHLDAPLVERLAAYVRGGGTLLAAGPSAAPFAPLVGATLGAPLPAKGRFLAARGGVELTPGAHAALTWHEHTTVATRGRGTVLATLHDEADPAAPLVGVAATLHRLGRGSLVLAPVRPGRSYLMERTAALRQWMAGVAGALLPDPLVRIAGSTQVDVVLRGDDAGLVVHLLDRDGQHMSGEVFSFDELRPTPVLTVSVRCGKPAGVTIAPSVGRAAKVEWRWKDGVLTATVPPFSVHCALVVDLPAAGGQKRKSVKKK